MPRVKNNISKNIKKYNTISVTDVYNRTDKTFKKQLVHHNVSYLQTLQSLQQFSEIELSDYLQLQAKEPTDILTVPLFCPSLYMTPAFLNDEVLNDTFDVSIFKYM